MDNLITACKRCNSGKSARSISEIPAPAEVVKRMNAKATTMIEQADAIALAIEARAERSRQVFALKESVYQRSFDSLPRAEVTITIRLIDEFGPDTVLEWMETAAGNGVSHNNCIKYVCGIARNARMEENA